MISPHPSATSVVDEGSVAENRSVSNSGPGHNSYVSGGDLSDPAPVQELRVMAEYPVHDILEASSENIRPASFTSSAVTLSGFNAVDRFDLEKILRHIIRK
jgi:hypothetical protein